MRVTRVRTLQTKNSRLRFLVITRLLREEKCYGDWTFDEDDSGILVVCRTNGSVFELFQDPFYTEVLSLRKRNSGS